MPVGGPEFVLGPLGDLRRALVALKRAAWTCNDQYLGGGFKDF